MGKGSEGYETHEASNGCQSLFGISVIKESHLDTFFITPRNLGSCVLLTPAIECPSILAIDTSIDLRSTLDRHSIDISVDPWSTLDWHMVDISVDRLSIFVDTLSSGD